MTDQTEPLARLDAEQKIISEHTTTLHVIGEQLAQIESWFWAHLADVRDAARRETGGPLPDDVVPAAPAGVTPATDQTDPHSCDNCDGIDPDTCLFNPERPKATAADETERRDRYAKALRRAPFDELRADWGAPNGPLKITARVNDLADAVMALADAEQAELRRRITELESQCRDVDRLRKDWVAMRDRTEALDDRVKELADTPPPAAAPAADQAALQGAIAHALEREDAINAGYDHGFASKYGVDQETDGFVDAVLAVVPDTSRAAVRCSSCEHETQYHDVDGRCWFTVEQGVPGSNLVCPCLLRRMADEQPL